MVFLRQNAGLGDVVKSWVGTGANMPVKPADLKSALGEKAVTNIAGQAGVSENDLLAQLSKALPGVVDKFTPNGRIPSLSEITDLFRQK